MSSRIRIDDAHTIIFRPSGRGKAQCPPDSLYPNGKALDCSEGGKSCDVKLPYPAAECGTWAIQCKACDRICHVTAAGRPDEAKERIVNATGNLDS